MPRQSSAAEKLKAALKAIGRAIPQASTHRAVQAAQVKAIEAFRLGSKTRGRLTEAILKAELPVRGATSSVRRIYAFHRPVHPLEVAMAFAENTYICHSTALYWNQMIDQVPTNYFVAIERKAPTRPNHTEEIDQGYLEEQFMKPHRETGRTAELDGIRYTVLERDATGLVGVVRRNLPLDGRQIRYACTNVERTMIDSAVFPHRSGGILTVMQCLQEGRSRFSITRLIEYYQALDFTYPYWQRIGFLLAATGQRNKAAAWREAFGDPQYQFYLDRPFRSDWVLDPDWSIYYPPRLLG